MCLPSGGGGSPPPPVELPAPIAATPLPPPPATAVDPAVLAARQNARLRAEQSQGRQSTILTSPVADTDVGGKKSLLGT